MLRKKLENIVGKLSNAEFETICRMATEDIKFNRIHFKKITKLDYVLDIAVKSAQILKKCA